jgi:hypothetical protein
MDNDSNFHLLYSKFGAFRKLDDTGEVYNEGGGAPGIITPTSGYIPPNGTTIRVISTSDDDLITTNVYYVVNASSTDFQLSLTVGGAAIDFGSGSSTIAYVIQDADIGSREYILYPQTSPMLNASRNSRIPYWTELDVSMYMTSSASRDVYGGFQREPLLGATIEQPIPMLDLQGSQDGPGMLRTPFQLTKSATVLVRVRSRSAYPLRVYGHLFGYKITV